MKMIPVNSSNISSVGYENGTLKVKFKTGGTYAYFDVPENVFNELIHAFSVGEYFTDNIKKVYKYQKLF